MSSFDGPQPVAGPSRIPKSFTKRKRGEADWIAQGDERERLPPGGVVQPAAARSRGSAKQPGGSRRPTVDDEVPSDDSLSEPEDDLQDPEAFRSSGPLTWTYHLEIIQQPQRVRACGFGNKDRRPLSPPPIIRLWVRTPSGQLVDPVLIDTRFLVLMVDLWSADRQQERNVVMHPVSAGVTRMDSPTMSSLALADLASVPGPSSRPSTGSSRPITGSSAAMSSVSGGSWRATPQTLRSHSSIEPSGVKRPHRPSTADARLQPVSPSSHPDQSSTSRTQGLSGSGLAYHQHRLLGLGHGTDPPRPNTAPSSHPHPQPPSVESPSPRAGSYNLPSLASISELHEANPSSSSRLTLPALQNASSGESGGSGNGSPWGRPPSGHGQPQSVIDPTLPRADYSFGRPSSSSSGWQPSTSSYPSSEYGREGRRPSSAWSDMRPWTSGLGSQRHSASSESTIIQSPQIKGDPTFFGSSDRRPSEVYRSVYPETQRYAQSGIVGGYASEQYSQWEAEERERERNYDVAAVGVGVGAGAAAQYSRVLVGKVTAVCHKLQDENGHPGLFFFAADLGIRTEGSFTLRLALTDLTSLMRPHTTLGARAPILAEIFTDPFTVFSAKRFPGVIPTTTLTKVFAAQGVKLSVRESRKVGEDEEVEEDD